MKVSTRHLAELTGIDRPRIASRLRDLPHDIGPNRAHLFDSRQALRAIYSADSDGAALDPAQARARLDTARAEKTELDLAAARGELLPAEVHRDALADALKIVASTLEALPDVLERDAGIGAAGVARAVRAVDALREELYRKLTE